MKKNLLKVFSNSLVRKGKKIKIERICLNFLKLLKFNTAKNPILTFNYSLNRAKPLVTLKGKKVAGTSLKIPVLVPTGQDVSVSIKWLIESLNLKIGNEKVDNKLVLEINDILSNKGYTVKKKTELHKLALSNRPFLKYL